MEFNRWQLGLVWVSGFQSLTGGASDTTTASGELLFNCIRIVA